MAYTFDFSAEERLARSQYPAETKDAGMFLVPDQAEAYRAWFHDNACSWETIASILSSFVDNPADPLRIKIQKLRGIAELSGSITQTEQTIDAIAEGHMRQSAFVPAYDDGLKHPVVIVNNAEGRMLADREKDLFFAFWHEVGHLVIFGADKPAKRVFEDGPAKWQERSEQQLEETAADLFALLHGLSRGILNAEDARHISDTRLCNLFCGDYGHFTSAACDRVVRDAPAKAALAPGEIKVTALAYARTFQQAAPKLEQLREILDGFKASHRGIVARISPPEGRPSEVLLSSPEARGALTEFFSLAAQRYEADDSRAVLARRFVMAAELGNGSQPA